MLQNQRTKLLLGHEGFEKLSNSHVLIAGLGGVGGYALEQLVRAGVLRFTLVDADVINVTNINRQIIALNNNVGQRKTEEFKKRIQLINPNAEVNDINVFLKDNEITNLLRANSYDYVIDAIDTLSPKVHFLKTCHEMKIAVVSSMGAGGKLDLSKVQLKDISKTHTCSLARSVRQRLNKLGIKSGIDTVFSSELVKKESVCLEETQNKKSNVGTISYMPAVFGLYCAHAAVNFLINQGEK